MNGRCVSPHPPSHPLLLQSFLSRAISKLTCPLPLPLLLLLPTSPVPINLRTHPLTTPKANAIGRSSKTVREFLEKNWEAGMSNENSIKLAVKSLLEVVQTGAKNIDLAVMEGFGRVRVSSFPLLEDESRELMWFVF